MSIWEGDFYAAKGVAMACLATPRGPLHVYNTHINANYNHLFKHSNVSGAFLGPKADFILLQAQNFFLAFHNMRWVDLVGA